MVLHLAHLLSGARSSAAVLEQVSKLQRAGSGNAGPAAVAGSPAGKA